MGAGEDGVHRVAELVEEGLDVSVSKQGRAVFGGGREVANESADRALVFAAGHLLAFDNLSGLSPWLSDALCRLASGGSFAVRQLYTNDEEVLFKAARPTLLNGIEDVISRPDLADRAIYLTLPPIAERRRGEASLWEL